MPAFLLKINRTPGNIQSNLTVLLSPSQFSCTTDSPTMPQSHSRSYRSNLRALKNMAIIVGLFVVCWAPFLVLNIAEALHPSYFISHANIRWVHSVVFAMFMFNSVVNPIVYAVRFRKFKAAFRLMLGGLKEEERQAALESVTSMWEINKYESNCSNVLDVWEIL